MRVVSLLPSATELVYALGIEPVGVSHECDYPPAARDLPTVIETRIDPDATSAEIDEQVAVAEREGGVYAIDRETLADLDPDVVVSQGICEVCAVDDTRVREAVADLGLGAEIVTTDPHSLGDVLEDVERLGAVLDREERARQVVADLESSAEQIRDATPDEGPRVAVLDWLDPVMVAGHWVPELVELCGGSYGLAGTGERSRPREWADIRAYDPEVLVAAPCGFECDQTLANATDLTGRDGWADLAAVESGRVYAVDGHNYVNRPGPRLVETLALFATILSPGAVDASDGAVDTPDEAIVSFPSVSTATD